MNSKQLFDYKILRVCQGFTGVLILWIFALAGAQASTTTRVSISSSGVEANNVSYISSVSADGRYVAFESSASNLVVGDTNGTDDVFVYDTITNSTTRISVSSSGVEANHGSSSPTISDDGRYVVFLSYATNLVAGDTNGSYDIFIHDTTTSTTTRVSISSSGVESNGNNYDPKISADGRYVAFYSYATNLVVGDTNGVTDVFIHDTIASTTTRVSISSSGVEGNLSSFGPSISADGRYVAFSSHANNLVAGDNNFRFDIFIHDTTTNITTRISLSSSGIEGTGNNYDPAISANGRYVAFESSSSDLVVGDTNGETDIFLHDTTTNITTRISLSSSGVESNSSSENPAISADGRYVAFDSFATNLVAGDTNGSDDVFIHNTTTSITTRASISSSGVEADNGSFDPAISANGRYISFISHASNLIIGDNNERGDIFVYEQTIVAVITPTSVPAMSQWGLLFMATLLGLFGFTRRKINMVS